MRNARCWPLASRLIVASVILLTSGCDLLGLDDSGNRRSRGITLSKSNAVPGEVVMVRNLSAEAGGTAVEVGATTVELLGSADIGRAGFVVPELAPAEYNVRVRTEAGKTLNAGRLQVRPPTLLGGKPEVAVDSMEVLSTRLRSSVDRLLKSASLEAVPQFEKANTLPPLAGEMLASLERGLQRLTPEEQRRLALMISANPEILNVLEMVGRITSVEPPVLQAASHAAPAPTLVLRDTSSSLSLGVDRIWPEPIPAVPPGAKLATKTFPPIGAPTLAQSMTGQAISATVAAQACRSMKEGLEALEEVAMFVNIASIAATAAAVGTVGGATPGAVVIAYMAVATNLTLIYLNTRPFLLDNSSLEIRVSPVRVKAGSSNGVMTARVRRVSPVSGLGAVAGVTLAMPGVNGALSNSAGAAIQMFSTASRDLLDWLAHPGVRSALADLGAGSASSRLVSEIAKVDEALQLSTPFAEETPLTFQGIEIQPQPEWSVGGPSNTLSRRIIVVDMPTDTTIELSARIRSPDSDCSAAISRHSLAQGINGFRIDGSFPPVIMALVFPTVIINVPGVTTTGRVEFVDREGDVMQLEATVAGVNTVVYDLSVDGVKSGSVPISVVCPAGDHTHCRPGPYLLRAVLIDRHGNRSKPAEQFFFAE